MPAISPFKERQRRHWDEVANGWATWLEWIERNFRPVTDWIQSAVAWTPGARVLDVGCGAGYPSLMAGRLVSPEGSVVAIDTSPRMLEAARSAAERAGLHNISFLEMDGEHLQLASNSFDAVTNTYGLMFCEEPACAIAEAHRVLMPDRRLAVVVWDEPEKSPYFSVITGVAVRQLALQAPQPGGPGPFRFASADALESLLSAAGLSDIQLERAEVAFECASTDEYCQMFGDLAWKTRMAALSSDERRHFVDKVDVAARPYLADGVLRLVATSLCASGRKAG